MASATANRYVGKTFHRWKVVRAASRKEYYVCRCECGHETEVHIGNMRSGRSKGCGSCRNKTHGMSGTSTYHIWSGIIERCTNPRHRAYHNYGGRGISVCEKWKSFAGFFEDMGERPKGLSIERIDNDGDYCLSNCKWATKLEQVRNMRTTRRIKFRGEEKSLSEWCEMFGIDKSTVRARLRQGWPKELALTSKPNLRRKKWRHSTESS